MELNEKVNRLEDEVKIIKNEVQAVLLDIRESYLNHENPFNPEVSSPTLHSVAATITGQLIAPAAPAAPSTPVAAPPAALAVPPAASATPLAASAAPPVVQEAEPEERKEVQIEEPRAAQPASPPAKEKKVATATTPEPEAVEEVNEAPRSEEEQPEVTDMQETRVQQKKVHVHARDNGKIDLVTIAGLTKWVGGAVRTLGRARTETVLDFAELTGHLPPELKNTLVKFAGHAPENGHIGVKSHDLITSIIELEGLLGMENNSDELTLLTMVCQEVDP